MPAPSLVPSAAEQIALDETKVREMLASLHAPWLDEWRTRVTTMRTSELLIACNPEVIAEMCRTQPDADEKAVAAALIAVADEIDRRIPIPKAAKPATSR